MIEINDLVFEDVKKTTKLFLKPHIKSSRTNMLFIKPTTKC